MSAEFEVHQTAFGMVPEWVDDIITDGNAMRVYVRLARKYANAKTRECYPSQAALADELGMSEKTVKRAIATLKDCGALFVRRSRRDDGKLGRNRYWLPMDQVGEKYRDWLSPELISPGRDQGSTITPGDQVSPGQPQGSATTSGHHGSPVTRRPRVTGDPSGNQTYVGTRRTTPDAVAPELPLGLPEPVSFDEGRQDERPPTLNQRAVRLAQAHYQRLGNLGRVPAFMQIIRKALERGYADEKVDQACAHIAEHNWTLTEERLANTLRGGPKRPSAVPDKPVVRTGPNGTGPILEY